MTRVLLSVVALAALVSTPAARADARVGALQARPGAAQAPAKPSGRTAAKPSASGVVNINTASASELQGLPGIGAKTAQRIVEYRQKNGPFKKVEELMNVRGIGEKNFLKLKPQLSIGAAKTDDDATAR